MWPTKVLKVKITIKIPMIARSLTLSINPSLCIYQVLPPILQAGMSNLVYFLVVNFVEFAKLTSVLPLVSVHSFNPPIFHLGDWVRHLNSYFNIATMKAELFWFELGIWKQHFWYVGIYDIIYIDMHIHAHTFGFR